ncbi:MAG: DUF1109 domain-containing protein [Gammaproteobacteria bacterium]|nr:DUF1109 domain-containing protein [Gammaproteobacteria bacterium]
MRNSADTDALVESLSRGVRAVAPVWSPAAASGTWLILETAFVCALTITIAPLREGWFEQFTTVPMFTLEMLTGTIAMVLFAVASFRSAVPGLDTRLLTLAAMAMTGLWLASFVVGLLTTPALELGMAGKRDHCVWETFLYALPPLCVAAILTRRRLPLHTKRTAALAGLSAGLAPAVVMQIACMYEPWHILVHHVGPAAAIIAVAVVGTMLVDRYCAGSPRPGQT